MILKIVLKVTERKVTERKVIVQSRDRLHIKYERIGSPAHKAKPQPRVYHTCIAMF
jgi:hypothetical protein